MHNKYIILAFFKRANCHDCRFYVDNSFSERKLVSLRVSREIRHSCRFSVVSTRLGGKEVRLRSFYSKDDKAWLRDNFPLCGASPLIIPAITHIRNLRKPPPSSTTAANPKTGLATQTTSYIISFVAQWVFTLFCHSIRLFSSLSFCRHQLCV
jgi:hypothetical protein